MVKNPTRRDLGFQLLALYLLFVTPVVLAALIFDRFAAEQLEADVKAADLALARAIAQETNTVLNNALETVKRMSTYPAVVSADRSEMHELFSIMQTARPEVNLIYRLDEFGIMVFHYPTGPGSTIGWDFSFREYYQQARTTRQPLLSKGRISPTTEQPVATAVMPLWSEEQQFIGLVATNIKLQALSDTLASIVAEHRPEEDFQVTIIDSDGQIIAHPDPSSILVDMTTKLPQVTQAVLSGDSNNLIVRADQGEERLYSYVPIPATNWGVIVSRPTAAAFATSRTAHRGIIFAMAVFLVIGLFFWLGLSRQVIRPLEILATFSQTIGLAEGIPAEQREKVVALSQRPDQIGHLSLSLQRMEQAIEARLNELSTLLETSASVVSTLDSQIVLNRILEQVERLMGIEMCTIVALDEEHNIFRAQASRGLSKRYTEQLAINPMEPHSVTLQAIRSGKPIQISDVETDETYSALRPRARAEGYRSILAAPLKTQHAPSAALLVYRQDAHHFSAREINLLSNFANHAAMAIENATLFARSDMQLQEQTRRLEALIQSMHDGLILEDLQGRVLYANRRISELINIPLEELSHSSVAILVNRMVANAVDPEKARKEIDSALQDQEIRRVEFALRAGHQIRYLRLRVFDVTDSHGMPIGRGQILRDVTRNRELDRMKSSLISTVSHELRTPLASIKGYATTLLAEDVEWDTVSEREFLEIISHETDRLTNLVNDLLDISRIEAGNLIVSRIECQLDDLVQQATEQIHPNPADRLQIELPDNLPRIFADPQRVTAVLRNLVENAVKYTNDNSKIIIRATLENGGLVVRVEDQGPGIPENASQRIFESFYRVEGGLTRSTPGAGLGLAICQGFVRAHGGDIWIEPRTKGTCVSFSLPLGFNLTDNEMAPQSRVRLKP